MNTARRIMLTSLDRDAEFRADEAAQMYVARAGMNPLALYSVFQKMAALGSGSPSACRAVQDASDRSTRGWIEIDKRGYGALAVYTTRE